MAGWGQALGDPFHLVPFPLHSSCQEAAPVPCPGNIFKRENYIGIKAGLIYSTGSSGAGAGGTAPCLTSLLFLPFLPPSNTSFCGTRYYRCTWKAGHQCCGGSLMGVSGSSAGEASGPIWHLGVLCLPGLPSQDEPSALQYGQGVT